MTDLQKTIREEREKNLLSFKQIAFKYSLPIHYVKRVCSKKFMETEKRKEEKKKKDAEFFEDVKRLLPQANSLNHLCNLMGYRGVEGYYKKIKKFIEENNLSTDHFGTIPLKTISGGYNQTCKMPDDEYFANNTTRNGKRTLQRLINSGYKNYQCEECGISEWRGEVIILQVHHINENHKDNRIENLKILCPNCHSQKHYGEHSDRYNFISKTVEKNKKQQNINQEEILKISQELIDDFKKYKSFRGVGKKYGISDNAIRKRCKKFGIFDEIQKYIISRKRK